MSLLEKAAIVAYVAFNLWVLWHLNAWQMKHRGWSGRLIERWFR